MAGAAEPSTQKFGPGPQGIGSAVPSEQKYPSGQGPLHAALTKPVEAPNFPAGQGRRTPSAQKEPAGHLAQPEHSPQSLSGARAFDCPSV